MKKILLAFLLLSTAPQVAAQEWKNDIDKALREAASINKKVMLFFTVSEQCDNCSALDRNVFRSEEFRDYAKENYILVKIDFSQKPTEELTDKMIEKNLLIIEKYNKDGFFPLVVILNKDAKVLGKAGVYKDESPSQFVKMLRNF
ncbi:MAG: thiol-disulfide isomerase [Flavobacterium sp. BFFFF1]|uniref:thioredoxin family protein n=1 Tax=unclassified Flavobacterium TaxID=196869 RepID=UPI000BC63DA5|nr:MULTISPECIES: thioredoxin family protein [unclassified Flavobacterium]OYU81278.1 MAG: thiol-disulfide isomerase [Flavobacterium sp. BFFFF1]